MAPEVAINGAARATTASDVYGLGAILYKLLTGQPPLLAGSLPALLKKLADEEVVAPRSNVPRDLESICLKCLEKEPSRRYEGAQALLDELNRFLSASLSRPDRFHGWNGSGAGVRAGQR